MRVSSLIKGAGWLCASLGAIGFALRSVHFASIVHTTVRRPAGKQQGYSRRRIGLILGTAGSLTATLVGVYYTLFTHISFFKRRHLPEMIFPTGAKNKA